MATKKELREGFYTCIRYAWKEISAPHDNQTELRVTNLISAARKCYNKLKDNEIMLQELNELERKLKIEVTN